MKLRLILLVFLAAAAGALGAQDPRFSISPNPASQQVNITFAEAGTGQVRVELYTVLGQKVASVAHSLREGALVLNTSALPEGFYLVKVSSGEHSFVKRLKIQHS